MHPIGATKYAMSGLNTISETPPTRVILVFNEAGLLMAFFTILIIAKRLRLKSISIMLGRSVSSGTKLPIKR